MNVVSLLLLAKFPIVLIKQRQLFRTYSQFKTWKNKSGKQSKIITNEP